MDTQALDQDFFSSLQPAPPHFGGTGALPLVLDPRDYPPEAHPDVKIMLEVGAPGEADRSTGVFEILNQGASGACVAFSTSGGIEADENLDAHKQYHIDAAALYRELGGTGQNGVDSRQTLQRCVDEGAPLIGGGRIKIGSYFRCDNDPGLFVEQIKAAVSTGQVVVIATLLPNTFGGRWQAGQPTQGYHQLLVLGFRGDLFWGPNSWGSAWPGGAGPHPPGFYELSFAYAVSNNFLGGYTYAFFFDPAVVHTPDPQPNPNPQPNPQPNPDPQPQPQPQPASVTIAGKVTGANLSAVAVGSGYQLQGNGLVWPFEVTQVNGPQPDPQPNPNPNPNPQPQPQPDPTPDTLTVRAQPGGIFTSFVVQDQQNNYVAAVVECSAAGQPVPLARSYRVTPAGVISGMVRWRGPGLTIKATAADGRTGSVTT